MTYFLPFPITLGTLLLGGIGALRIFIILVFTDIPYNFDSAVMPRTNTFDFIVVGSGPAGSAVSARLSETGASVLLLEAGGNAPPESAVPATTILMMGREVDWHFRGTSQKNSQFGFENNASYWSAGKMMGGSSSMNGLVYVRGNPKDYDNWEALGNVGWGYKSVFPYFLKLEDFRGQYVPGSEAHHSVGGPVSVESRRTMSKAAKAYIKAGIELGYDKVDGSGPHQIGVGPTFITTKNGVRASAAESYLRPIKDRPNLIIRPKAHVTKVLFARNKRAIGVEYLYKGQKRIAKVRKEIILSAGAINTPKILMLSGIGPPDHLRDMGIPVVAALNGVGQNLMDHLNFYLTWEVDKGSSWSFFDFVNPLAIQKYIESRQGVISDSFGLECNGFFNVLGDVKDWADVQLSMATISYGMDRGLFMAKAIGMKSKYYKERYGPFYNKHTLTINPCLLRPRSRGYVMLASPNPVHNPIIHQNFLHHPDDIKILVRGVRLAQKFVQSEAMRVLNPKTAKPLSSCLRYGADTDAYWECYIRHEPLSLWHYSGTAKMGPDSDPMAVVDPQLRVRGVKGLRVADTSIMPEVVSANTQAAAYMIGEKASDLVKTTWKYPIVSPPAPSVRRSKVSYQPRYRVIKWKPWYSSVNKNLDSTIFTKIFQHN